MKTIFFNKSTSTNTEKIPKSPFKEKSTDKHLVSYIHKNFLSLNNEYNPNYKKQINYRYYFKNPQFLNNDSMKNQLDILVTNINYNQNISNINKLSNSLKQFPKLKTINNSLNIHSRKSSFDSLITDKSNNNYNSIIQKEENTDYIYKRIFPNSRLFKEKVRVIDNKLNIIYSQNEKQYKILLQKRNNSLKKGNIMILERDSDKIKGQVEDIKTKIKFMKNIMDYSYPSLMLTKLKSWEKNVINYKKPKYDEKLTPFEEQKKLILKKNNIRSNYLKKNIDIIPIKINCSSLS